jgi:membrane associated rhomboid family serine protease
MIPIGDENPTSTTPFVNYLLLVANIAAFLWQFSLDQAGAVWVVPGYGVVPTRLLADPPGEAFTILTSMFMHGNWAHLGGNMLFLYIFGDNVEDAIGHFRYVLFYLLGGLVAAAAQILVAPSSSIPMVGASGAIAGVLGAYLVLFPRAPVTVFFGFLLLVFPAWLVIGEWFVFNLIAGYSSLGSEFGSGEGAGIAFFAHIGGFVAGILLIRPALHGRKRVKEERWQGWKPPPKRRPPGDPSRDSWRPRRRNPWQ